MCSCWAFTARSTLPIGCTDHTTKNSTSTIMFATSVHLFRLACMWISFTTTFRGKSCVLFLNAANVVVSANIVVVESSLFLTKADVCN